MFVTLTNLIHCVYFQYIFSSTFSFRSCDSGGTSSNLPVFSSSSLHYLKLRGLPSCHFQRLGKKLQTSCYNIYNFYFLISPLLEFLCIDDPTNHLLNLLINILAKYKKFTEIYFLYSSIYLKPYPQGYFQ